MKNYETWTMLMLVAGYEESVRNKNEAERLRFKEALQMKFERFLEHLDDAGCAKHPIEGYESLFRY